MGKSLIVAVIFCLSGIASALTIKIDNKDAKTHTIKYTCDGQSFQKRISAARASSYTLHSTATSCKVVGGTIQFAKSTLKNGDAFTVQGGAAK